MTKDFNPNLYRGITDAQADESRRIHGDNIVTETKPKSALLEFFGKFRDPIIIILIVAWVLSMIIAAVQCWGSEREGLGAFIEPVGIFFAIMIATTMSFFFERKANKEFAILNQVNDDVAVTVVRDGKVTQVPRKDVVVDDIVILNTGDEVPADGTLLEAVSLQVNESSFTGEPLANKTVDSDRFDSEATYPSNEVLRGSSVTDGHGIMTVTAVGDSTAYGKLFKSVQIDDAVATPLQSQLARLAKVISRFGYLMALAIFIILSVKFFIAGGGSYTNILSHLLHYFMISVTLIVATVPEGLPMSVTLSLAMSMNRMLRTNNLVRKLHACETMGAATVICTDKTGTLTQNRMTVAETQFPALGNGQNLDDNSNNDARIIALDIAVNSTANLRTNHETGEISVIGNPTEGALLLWLNEKGVDYRKLRAHAEVTQQLTFSTERKYMATVIADEPIKGHRILVVKGAPEIVMAMCSEIDESADVHSDIYEVTSIVNKQLKSYQERAMRTLGFAYKILEPNESPFDSEKITVDNLIFLGVVAISDPVRDDVPEAVEKCHKAGINVIMVTGDTRGTATEIARETGIIDGPSDDNNVISGADFERLPDAAASQLVKTLKVMCRARPHDKQRLVKLLQGNGEIVAVTGDGTNDAPALKAAHVGISMGDGTAVAKEASDITILDNSFANITRAVMWGRSLYRNIQRFLIFQLSISFTACVVVFLGSLIGMDSPLTVTQMLYVNLIMDTFAAAAFASLPPDVSVLNDSPRSPLASIITKPMWRWIAIVTSVFVAVLVLVLAYANCNDYTFVRQSTLIFTTFIMLQFWNMWNAKSFMTDKSAFSNLAEQPMFLGVEGLIVVGLVLIVTFGGAMFSTTALSLCTWFTIVVLTAPVLLAGEMSRLIKRLGKK